MRQSSGAGVYPRTDRAHTARGREARKCCRAEPRTREKHAGLGGGDRRPRGPLRTAPAAACVIESPTGDLVTINLTPKNLREDHVIYKRERFIMLEERLLSVIAAVGLTPSATSHAYLSREAVMGEPVASTG